MEVDASTQHHHWNDKQFFWEFSPSVSPAPRPEDAGEHLYSATVLPGTFTQFETL